MTACPACGATGGHLNVRGGYECSGCGQPLAPVHPPPAKPRLEVEIRFLNPAAGGIQPEEFQRMMRRWLS